MTRTCVKIERNMRIFTHLWVLQSLSNMNLHCDENWRAFVAINWENKFMEKHVQHAEIIKTISNGMISTENFNFRTTEERNEIRHYCLSISSQSDDLRWYAIGNLCSIEIKFESIDEKNYHFWIHQRNSLAFGNDLSRCRHAQSLFLTLFVFARFSHKLIASGRSGIFSWISIVLFSDNFSLSHF